MGTQYKMNALTGELDLVENLEEINAALERGILKSVDISGENMIFTFNTPDLAPVTVPLSHFATNLQGHAYIGLASPSTTPVTLKGNEKVFYIATEEGDYSNFGCGNVSELSVIKSDNKSWKAEGLGILIKGMYNVIENSDKVFYPARPNGTQQASGSFKGYKVDLNGLKERGIDAVKFQCSVYDRRDVIILANVYHKDGSISDIKRKDGDEIFSVQWKTLDIDDTMDYMIVTYGSAQTGEYTSHIFDPHVVYFLITDNSSSEISELIGGSLKITNFEIVNYPARTNGAQTASGTFKGYKVDLSNYSSYQQVYFNGSNGADTQNISRGIIIDKFGGVEFYVPIGDSYTSGWQSLPITDNSAYLLATFPISDQYASIVLWTPEYVELKTQGIVDKVAELEDRVELIEEKQNFESKVNVHLPSDIYIIKDKTSQFFYRGFIEAVDPYIYDIKVKCAIGKTFRRYYEITPAQIGDYPFTLEVRDNNRNILSTASSTIHVVDKTFTTSNKNVLCVGASATATGYWPSEIKRMSENMSLNLNYVGRLVGSRDNSVNLEAIGGWTWGTFIHGGVTCIRFFISGGSGDLTINSELSVGDTIYTVLEINLTEGVGNIRCAGATQYTNASEPSSPQGVLQAEGVSYNYTSFVKESFVPFPNGDFTEYADTYCNGHIDIMMIHMGVNSMLREYSAIPENDIKAFLDGYFNSFPEGKVLFAAIPMPDYGTSVYSNTNMDNNVNRYGTLHSFMEYNDYMYHLSQEDYKGRLLYCPGSIFFDTDYGYPKTQKNVNTRISAIKETIDTNGMHPIAEGSYLIADSILPVLIKMLEP